MRYLMMSALASIAAMSTPAAAQTIASSNFTTGAEGWTNGDFTFLSSTSAVTWNAGGSITVNDNYGLNAFVAPSAYLGNQSAAFGGTISFTLSALANDNLLYSPVALIGAGLTLFSTIAPPPAASPTSFSISLIGANFTLNNPYGPPGTLATDAQLQSVLASLDRLAIQADWLTGGDTVTLDNVVLAGPAVGAVPEPATWAMLILGFGVVGGTLRRRRHVRVSFA